MQSTMRFKEKDVELKPKSHGKWDLKHDGKTGDHNGPESDPTSFPVIKLDQDDGPHLIAFEIKNSNAVFAKKDPIWVKEGSKPLPGEKHDHDQIAWRPDPTGKILYMVDWNDNHTKNTPPIDLHYQLNFENPQSSLDPIINNGGSTKPFIEPPQPPPPPPTPVKSAETGAPSGREGYLGQFGGLDVAAILIGLGLGLALGFALFRR